MGEPRSFNAALRSGRASLFPQEFEQHEIPNGAALLGGSAVSKIITRLRLKLATITSGPGHRLHRRGHHDLRHGLRGPGHRRRRARSWDALRSH